MQKYQETAFFVIHPSIERLTGREIGAPLPQHPYQSRMGHVSAASFSHDSDFPTFSPAAVSWTSPTARQPPRRALTLNLTVSLLTPAPVPGRGRPHLPPGRPQLTAGLAKATSSNRRAENSKILMAQRCAAPPARSRQNLYPRPL